VLNLGKDSRNRKIVKERMKKGEVVAARTDGSVIMQWQGGKKKCRFHIL
jgi:hypothetical protein